MAPVSVLCIGPISPNVKSSYKSFDLKNRRSKKFEVVLDLRGSLGRGLLWLCKDESEVVEDIFEAGEGLWIPLLLVATWSTTSQRWVISLELRKRKHKTNVTQNKEL